MSSSAGPSISGVRIRSHGSNTTRNSGEFPRYVYLLVIRFLETLEFPMFSISGKLQNSDVSDFRKLRTPKFFDISHSFMYFTFHLWLRSFPLFHVLFSFMYSGLLSVPSTYLSHSLVYKHLYSVARILELRLLLSLISSFALLSPLRDLEDLSPARLLIILYSLLVSRSRNSGVWNSHAPSHSEIWDPWGIPQGTGQYPESAPVTRIRCFLFITYYKF